MYKIVKKERLNDVVELMEVHAPMVARKCEPGQFIILRENDEYIISFDHIFILNKLCELKMKFLVFDNYFHEFFVLLILMQIIFIDVLE